MRHVLLVMAAGALSIGACDGADSAVTGAVIVDSAHGSIYQDNPNRRVLTGQERTAKGVPDTSSIEAKVSALVTGTGSSGPVHTQIVQCSGDVERQHNIGVACSVDPDYVLVGGGAFADFFTGEGALLTETRPMDWRLATWVASSKDHVKVDFHRLIVQAIGLKVDGISRDQLFANMQLRTRKDTHREQHPNFTATVDPGYVVVGGGVNLRDTIGPGTLLTGSFPSGERNWVGSGKDHIQGSWCSIEVSAIGLRSGFIPGFRVQTRQASDEQNAACGGAGFQGHERVSATPGGVVLSPGGLTDYFGAGRLIFDIMADPAGATVSDKDHVITDCMPILSAFVTELVPL